jgi:hypothetical protein
MRRRTAYISSIAFSIIWSICRAACPTPEPVYPTPKVSAQQIADLVASIKRRPGMRCAGFGARAVRCSSDGSPEIWWFTESGHRAHPAASRGQMAREARTGETCLLRDGYFAGEEVPFAAWFNELKRYDEATLQRFKALQRSAT